jgi:glycosyltransferase involved in cell wall biosynthesis
MRITYLHQYFNTPANVGGTRSYEMARRLVKAGHSVNMITTQRDVGASDKWSVTQEDGITVHWLPVPYSNTMSYSERIRAFMRFAYQSAARAASIPADVIFATSTPLTIAIPAVYAKWRQKVQMVFEVRDLWPEIPIAVGVLKSAWQIRMAQQLERFAYRNSAAIVALSQGMKEGIARTGYPADKITVIPNSSDLALFDVPTGLGQEFRARHDWLQERPLIVYAGTLGKINGVGYMARIAQAALAIDSEVRFLVVGNGVEEEEIRNRAAELGVLNNNFFHLSAMPKYEIPQLFSAATISTSFVIDLPELWANSANKFFDSLAAGKPIAINHQGWQADLLRQYGAGIVLPPDEPSVAAKLLIDAVHNISFLESASAASKMLARTQFDRDLLAKQLETVLQQVVK